MKCKNGHEGAVALFTGIACDFCDSVERIMRLRQVFFNSVKKFGLPRPNRARVGSSMREALSTWRGCPPELTHVTFEPENIEEGLLEIMHVEEGLGTVSMTFHY